MTKNNKGQHVNSIITTMASKCLSARQIKILEETLQQKVLAFNSELLGLELEMKDRAGYFGPELAEMVSRLSKKEAKDVLTKIVYSPSDSSRGGTPPEYVQKALLPKSEFDALKLEIKLKEVQIQRIEQAARTEGEEIHGALVLAINFMMWSENVPAVVCNSFDDDLAAILKEAIEKMEAAVAEPIVDEPTKPGAPQKPKVTKRLKKTKKNKGAK